MARPGLCLERDTRLSKAILALPLTRARLLAARPKIPSWDFGRTGFPAEAFCPLDISPPKQKIRRTLKGTSDFVERDTRLPRAPALGHKGSLRSWKNIILIFFSNWRHLWCLVLKANSRPKKQNPPEPNGPAGFVFGAGYQIRTGDLLVGNETL